LRNPSTSDCEDIDLINELDGFQRSPRISIPFDGDIDPATVGSDTVFLVSLGSTLPDGEAAREIIGIAWLRYSDKVFGGNLPRSPHAISQLTDSTDAATRALALAIQRQAARFLASDGTFVPDPDGAGPAFEFPISDPDRDGLNYLPQPCPPGTPSRFHASAQSRKRPLVSGRSVVAAITSPSGRSRCFKVRAIACARSVATQRPLPVRRRSLSRSSARGTTKQTPPPARRFASVNDSYCSTLTSSTRA
jgi:hypothetical protein